MTTLIKPLAILCLLFAVVGTIDPAAAREERKSHGAMVLDATDKVVIPHLETLDKSADDLAKAVSEVCVAPSDIAKRNAAEQAFARVASAWAAIEVLRAGPITSASRLERVFFWPDPRGTTARQLAEVLAKRDPAVLERDAFASQSAAVQGLTALEYLLYDDKLSLTGTDDGAAYRCSFAQAIARNLASIGQDLLAGWTAPDGFRMKLLTPGSDNPLYKDGGESARDIVKAVVTGLELASNRFAAPEIEAAAAKPPKRPRIPFDRSGQSGMYLTSSIKALEALYQETALTAFVPADKAWMEAFIPRTWSDLEKDAAKLSALKDAPPGDPARLAAANKLKFDLGAIRQVIVRELAPAAELTLGFNELDGD